MSKKGAAISNVWMLSREYGSLAGAGGVKDVVSQLAGSLAGWSGRSVNVVLPLYGFIDPEQAGFHLLSDPLDENRGLVYEVDMNFALNERRESVRVWKARMDRVNVYLLDSLRFREKEDVYTYTAAEESKESWKKEGEGHYDYFAMNVLLQKATLDLMMILDSRPDVIHCHDGHTALVPAMIAESNGYRQFFRKTAAVVTIHNAGKGYHQEVADLPFAHAVTGLPKEIIEDNCLDDSFDPLLAASSYGEMTTVSSNYARELQETDDDALTGWLGHELLLRGVVLHGVTNGIDPAAFDPSNAEQSGIKEPFDPLENGPLAGKRSCKEDMLEKLAKSQSLVGIQQAGFLENTPLKPLFTFIGRLSEQKGVGILIQALTDLLKGSSDFQFLLLGTGGKKEEQLLVRLAEQADNRGRVCVLRGFDPALAREIYAAGDFFLIPSQYEPCGLTDFMAQLYGNLPIVHHVGGLVKVIDQKTGLAYSDQSSAVLANAMQQAIDLYHDQPERLRKMQKAAVERIHTKHTWDRVKDKYVKLYKQARRLKRKGE